MKRIADWLFGMTPILIGMFAIILYLILETTFLLHDIFPDYVRPDVFRWLLAVALASAFHLTVLNITVNHDIIPRGFAIVTALIAAVVTAFFFDVINPLRWQQLDEAWVRDLIFSMIVGFCGFAYVFLFVKKYQLGQIEQGKQAEIERLQGQVEESNREVDRLKEAETSLQVEVNRYQTEASNARQLLKETKQSTVVNGQVKTDVVATAVACDFCQRKFKSARGLANRKGYCTKEPQQCKQNKTLQESLTEN